jgi:predicted dehydrogenase
MSKPAHLAFIGLGPMGLDLLREAVKQPKIEVMALCDVEPAAIKTAQDLIPTAKSYADYHSLLSGEGLDGVVIAVPQHLHAQISIDCLKAGINTFCEKPMGLSVGECRAMIETAKKFDKSLMIGQVLRYIGPYRYIIELVEAGELGAPLAMRTIRSQGGWGTWGRPWRLKRETSGGLLLEVNVHEIDLMLGILGEAESVTGAGRHFPDTEEDFESFITAQIRFKSGAIGSITSVRGDNIGRNTAEIYLTGGTIYYDSMLEQLIICRNGKEREVLPYKDIHPEWENGVGREIREFAEACLGEHAVTIPGERGLRAVEVAQAAYQSAAEGATVTLPLPG